MIVDDITNAIKSGRRPIVLTERTEHVAALAELLKRKCSNVITLVGGMKAKEKRSVNSKLAEMREEEEFVIVATGKYAGEGFDFPRLDTLFLAMPVAWKGKVAQYTGRLHRLYDDKTDVVVYDVFWTWA